MAQALLVGRSDQGDVTLGVDDRDGRLRREESRDGRAGIRQRDGIAWRALRREPLPRLRGHPRFSGPPGDGTIRGPGDLIQVPQIQASFEDRVELDKRDREVIKDLGLKFRGRNAWPMFRSYRPSLLPWFLEAGEVRFLSYALEQLADVAPRFREDSSLLEPSGGDSYLLRASRQEGRRPLWEDASTGVPPLDAPPIEVEMEASKIEALGRLPRGKVRLEVDFFMFPAPVQDEGDRPYFPHMLLVVDAGSGMVLGSDLLTPHPSLEAMWGRVPENLADKLFALELAPEKISVDSELLFELLEPLASEAAFGLELSLALPGLEPARENLLRTFGE